MRIRPGAVRGWEHQISGRCSVPWCACATKWVSHKRVLGQMASDPPVNASTAAMEPVKDDQLDAPEINGFPEREEAASEREEAEEAASEREEAASKDRKSPLRAAIEPVEDELQKFREGIDQLIDAAEINKSPAMDEAASKDRKSALLYSSILVVLASGRAVLETGSSAKPINIPVAGLHFSVPFSSILLVLWAVSTYYLASFLIASYRLLKRWELRNVTWRQKAESLLSIPLRELEKVLRSGKKAFEENQQALQGLQNLQKRREQQGQFGKTVGSLLREACREWRSVAEIKRVGMIAPLAPLSIEKAVQVASNETSIVLEPNDRREICNIIERNVDLIAEDHMPAIDEKISWAIDELEFYWSMKESDVLIDLHDSKKRYNEAAKMYENLKKRMEVVVKASGVMKRSYLMSIMLDVSFPCALYIGSLVAVVVWWRSP
jgi:hypothetical protein